jgi:hypothetical protein
MSNIISPANPQDPKVQTIIRKNQRVAKEAIKIIVHRHRKNEPEVAFENVVNTVGVICAELVRDAHEIAGDQFSEAIADLFKHHIDRAVMLAGTKGGAK